MTRFKRHAVWINWDAIGHAVGRPGATPEQLAKLGAKKVVAMRRCEICEAEIPGTIARTAMSWRSPRKDAAETIEVAPGVELAYRWVSLCSDECLSALLVRNERDQRQDREGVT